MRLFTVEEANALLPELTGLLEAVVSRQAEVSARRRELALLEARARADGVETATLLAVARRELESQVAELREAIERVTALAVELKDLTTGLIDFPADRAGRTVYPCWQLGEPEVAHWHELDGGFAGRQPL